MNELSKKMNNLPYEERQKFVDEHRIPDGRKRPRRKKQESIKSNKKNK